MLNQIRLHYVCPRCGRKLAPTHAMEHATIHVRRKCPACHLHWGLTISPVAISQGWAHSATITQYEPKVRCYE